MDLQASFPVATAIALVTQFAAARRPERRAQRRVGLGSLPNQIVIDLG
jgi:hypothetical protein